ncbi:MAG: hypothetical protein WB543_09675 [Candidatus Acidiferrum sp.]
MHVDVVEKITGRIGKTGAVAPDAAVSLAVKNFLAAIESDDSLFCVAQPLAGPSADESEGGRMYSGDIVLEFRHTEHSRQRSLHFLLLEKLAELLKEAGSQESLATTLCLTTASISVGTSESQAEPRQKELALWIRLAAKGDSAEQAQLRWGLGLAHIQQALLFSSRHLRLRLAQMGD